jgi:hypothetical protein
MTSPSRRRLGADLPDLLDRSGLPRLLSRWRPDGRARRADTSPRSEASLSHYDSVLAEEALVADVPADLLRAICWHASGWRQFEPGGRVLSTPAPQGTCYGCMQLNDVWHPDAFPAAMTDAQASIRYAASLLRWLHEQTTNWDRATVAFFGHDRRAELAARRVRRLRETRPWADRGAVVLDAGSEPAATVARTGG